MEMGILLLWHVDDKDDNLDTLMIAALVFGSLYISLAGTLNKPPLPEILSKSRGSMNKIFLLGH